MVGLVIMSMANAQCDMKPVGPGGDGDKPEPVGSGPLAPLPGPVSLAKTVVVDPGVELTDAEAFGSAIAFAGDLDGGDGTVLAVGATDEDGSEGAIYLLSYNAAGALQNTKKIANGLDETNTNSNSNAPSLADGDQFGSSLANAGDLYGDGNTVLAVGARTTDRSNQGAIYLLSFNVAGSLTDTKKITNGLDETNADSNANAPSLAAGNNFGSSLANAGDLDGGGGIVLAVGAGGVTNARRGAIHLLSFNATGSLTDTKKITNGLDETDANSNANAPSLTIGDNFGNSLANAGDLDGGGGTVLAVGATGHDVAIETVGSRRIGGLNSGAIHLLSFNGTGSLAAPSTQITQDTTHGPVLTAGYRFGSSLANVGNLDGSGGRVLAVGGIGDTSVEVMAPNKTGELQLLYFSSSKE